MQDPLKRIDRTVNLVARRRRTLRFVLLVGITGTILVGGIAFVLARSNPEEFASNFILNLLSEFFGALLVAWLLQGVLSTAAAEMQEDLDEMQEEMAAIRESDAALEQRLIEAEQALRDAEVRAEEAEERAEQAERILVRLRNFFSSGQSQTGLGTVATNFVNALLSAVTPSTDTEDDNPQQ